MLKETLCQIGLTNNEAKIYLTLVELGPQPANIIAKKSDLIRSTVYPILKGLQKKSLIGSFLKNGVIYFAVKDVHDLLCYVDRKKRFLDHQRDFVMDIIPKIELIKCRGSVQPKVQCFEGIEGVETVMNDSLNSAGPIMCIASIDKWLDSNLKEFVKDYIHTRIFIKKIPLKELIKDTKETRCFLETAYDGGEMYAEVMFVKDNDALFDNNVNIYDDKVAVVSLEKGLEFGVLIESAEFAKTQKSIFDLAWKGAMIHNEEYENKRKK